MCACGAAGVIEEIVFDFFSNSLPVFNFFASSKLPSEKRIFPFSSSFALGGSFFAQGFCPASASIPIVAKAMLIFMARDPIRLAARRRLSRKLGQLPRFSRVLVLGARQLNEQRLLRRVEPADHRFHLFGLE